MPRKKTRKKQADFIGTCYLTSTPADRAGETLPVSGGWADLAKYLRPSADKSQFKLRKPPPSGETPPEVSDNESESDDDE